MQKIIIIAATIILLLTGCDTSGSDNTIAPGYLVSGSLDNPGEYTDFSLTLSENSRLTFKLNHDISCDYDIYILQLPYTLHYAATVDNPETLTTTLSAGEYAIRIRSYSGSGSFTLSCTLLPPITRTFCTNNGGGTYTFLTIPNEFYPDATGHDIYLAGQMNLWGGSEVSLIALPNTNSILMTNRGDGTYVAVASNVTSGMEYKYIVDYDDNGMIDDTTDWKVDPAKPGCSYAGQQLRCAVTIPKPRCSGALYLYIFDIQRSNHKKKQLSLYCV